MKKKLAQLKEKIAEYMEILSSETRVLEIVKEEALVLRDKYGDDRRTEIANISGEVDIEDLIPEETCVFTMTTLGYIKTSAGGYLSNSKARWPRRDWYGAARGRCGGNHVYLLHT